MNGKMSKEERDFYKDMIDNYVLKEHYELVKEQLGKVNNIICDFQQWLKEQIENLDIQVSYSNNPTLGQSIYREVLKKLEEIKFNYLKGE